MSIEIQCPNPDCAKVHRVKNRWAGRRGTCPECGTIIKVPVNGMAMKHRAMEAPEPEALDEEAAAAAALAGADDEMDDWDAPPKKTPVADDVDEDADEKPARVHDEEEEDEEEAVRARDDEDEDEEPAPKKKAAALDDDEDEAEERITKRGRDEEDEDEEPALKKKAAALDDDDEDRITKRARDDDKDEPQPRKKAARGRYDDEDEDFDEVKPAASSRRFSAFLVVLYLLATLSILASATMFLIEQPGLQLNGKDVVGTERTKLIESLGLRELKGEGLAELKTVLLGAPIGIAVFGGIGLLVSVLKRNFGILSLIIGYLVVLACLAWAVFLFIGLLAYSQTFQDMATKFSRRPDVKVVDAATTWFWVGVGSAGAATLLYALAILLIHRRLWARIVFLVLMLLCLGGGLALIMHVKNEHDSESKPPKTSSASQQELPRS